MIKWNVLERWHGELLQCARGSTLIRPPGGAVRLKYSTCRLPRPFPNERGRNSFPNERERNSLPAKTQPLLIGMILGKGDFVLCIFVARSRLYIFTKIPERDLQRQVQPPLLTICCTGEKGIRGKCIPSID